MEHGCDCERCFRTSPALRASRLAVLGVFFANGVVIGTWVVRIPAVQQRLGLGGAALGGLLASRGVGPLPHFSAVVFLAAIACVAAYGTLLPSHADASEEGAPAFARPTRALLGLGIISFCVLLGEGAMGDWSAVYLVVALSLAIVIFAGAVKTGGSKVVD